MPIRPLHALSTLAAAFLLSGCASPYGGHWHWHQHTAMEAAGMPCGGQAMGGHHHGGMQRGGMGMGGHEHGGKGMMGDRGHDHDHGPGAGGMRRGGQGMMGDHGHDHGPGAGGMQRGGPGMMGGDPGPGPGGMQRGGRGMGDPERAGMNRMCEMHREMTAGKSPAEQQAAIEAHIRNMHGTVTAEMVEQHRRMIDSRCPPAADAPASAPAAR